MTTQSKLAVILHADIVGSTVLVHKDERVAHDRIQDAFRRFSEIISSHNGTVHELRGDALVAEFERVSDAVTTTLAFQLENQTENESLTDNIRSEVRVGIALVEVVIADNTVTGPGVVLAQRIEQLAGAGGLCISAAIHEAVPKRLPVEFESLGDQSLKGFDELVRVYSVSERKGVGAPKPGDAADSDKYKSKSPSLVASLPDRPSIAVLPFNN